MSNSNLASLPPSMLHKILSKVATSHLRDFGSARIAFSEFNQIGREEYFYRSADLFNLNDWIDEANVLRTFRIRCYQAGREKIRLAGERGLLWAKYVDGMLNLAFSVDARGFVHNYPSFSREFVDRMNYMITTSLSSGHWGYEKPKMDLEHGGHAIVVSDNVQLGTSAMIFT
uniref:F-box domain-containing protein n=1 Tax=Brassica oleracea var. oleracea TaxID=109376 RepID=A0A0D3D5I6_BRAOL